MEEPRRALSLGSDKDPILLNARDLAAAVADQRLAA
eukprot:SAG31_NODE_26862_length_435_cov_0.869048_1_plen_35_part_01